MPSNVLSFERSGWRSSHGFMTTTVFFALFTETLLFSFVVPILSYMFEVRLHIPSNKTQWLTTAMLSGHGLTAAITAPIIAHLADKTPSRRTPLLLALVGSIVGTAMIASTLTVEIVFAGRIIQAIAGSMIWIVGYACLSDNVDVKNIGKVMGTASAFASSGTISGPLFSGPLLKLLGYWPTWAVPLLVLMMILTACWLMVEERPASKIDETCSCESSAETIVSDPPLDQDTERTIMLQYDQAPQGSQQVDNRSTSFYRTLLLDVRVIACLSNVILVTSIITGFDATIPLHLRNIFGWDTLKIGLIFLALQLPTICFGRTIGWLRDRVGVRYPTTFAWVFMSPVLVILGIPGDSPFTWINSKINAEAFYVCTLVVLGIIFAFARGAGIVRLVGITKDMELKNPTLFGSHGGNARLFSMTEVSFSLGCIFGPLISGSLVELIGYFYMNVALGSICLAVALLTFLTF